MKDYLWRVLVSLDQTILNTILGPVWNFLLRPRYKFGNEDETMSSVLGKNVRNGSCIGCYVLCRILHLFDPGHCKKSIEDDEVQ